MDENKPQEVTGPPEGEPLPTVPPPGRWADVMDELIEEAMRAGAFDNLPGRGKPLKLQKNPHAPGTELAYQLLKDNNYTLPWISERKELLAAIESLRELIGHTWRRYSAEYRAARSDMIRLALVNEWYKRQDGWAEDIKRLNKRIVLLNLKQPGESFEILTVTLPGELERVGAARELA